MKRRLSISLSVALMAMLLSLGFTRTATASSHHAAINGTGTTITINNGPGNQTNPHISGDWVVYTDDASGINTIDYHNLATGADGVIPTGSNALDVLSAISGTTVVYTHVTATTEAIDMFDLSQLNAPPVDLAPLANSHRQSPAIGNRTVAWEDSSSNPQYSQIVVYNLDTQQVIPLTNDAVQNTNPAVSPDGSTVVWQKCTTTSTTGCSIWQATLDPGTGQWTSKQMNTDALEEELPTTNGQVVVYDAGTAGSSNQNHLYVQPLGGGSAQPIAFSGNGRNAHISGNLISFENFDTTGSPNWNVWVYNLTTQRSTQITTTLHDETLSDISVTSSGKVTVIWNTFENSNFNVYGFTYQADLTPPVLSLPGTITANATSPAGAVVNYTVTASDPDDATNTLTITCTPPSGGTFPIGTTTVQCSASDPAGNSASGNFQVVVHQQDTTAPILNLPGTTTVDATSPQGAVVPYTVTATDPDNAANTLTIICTPSSSSTFPIGTTTVQCSASDPAGNTSHGSFQMIVKGASDQINDLVTLVKSFHLKPLIQDTLVAELKLANYELGKNHTKATCDLLDVFSAEVQAATGHGITTDQATQLLAAAEQIETILGCS